MSIHAIDGQLLLTEEVAVPERTLSSARRSMSDEDFARFSTMRLFRIRYASGGLEIAGYLAIPPQQQPRMPALIFNRGGAGSRGALGDEAALATVGLYASWGYVSVVSNYRGQGGSQGREEWGAGDVDDAMNLLPLLRAQPYVDPDRIGLIAGSRGGMMAYMMLCRTNVFRACVTFGAPAAFDSLGRGVYIREMLQKSLPEGSDYDAEARKRSAVLWADKMCKETPLLVLHGSGDKKVDPLHSLLLAAELQKTLHPYRLVVYEGADHVLAGKREESNRHIREWVDRFVMHREKKPVVGPHGN